MAQQRYAYFGEKESPRPEGTFLFLVASIDLITRPPVGAILDEVAARLLRSDRVGTAVYGDRMVNSIVVLGYEAHGAPLAALHAAYNGMWERHPDLWERIQRRTFPMTFWLVDGERKPFHGIIQPAMHAAFELWAASDVRETDAFRRYLQGDDFRWQAALDPILPDALDKMCQFVESQRQLGSTAPRTEPASD